MNAMRQVWQRLAARLRRGAAAGALPGYAAWLAARIESRGKEYPVSPSPCRYSVISLVYERSDAAFLEEAHASLREQTLPFFEWIVLAQGALPQALEAVVCRLAGDPRVNVLRSKVNLGIIRGMRRCLEVARGDYVIPFDADDLLTRDALQLVDHGAHAAGRPAFLYSDEDALIAGKPRHPYLRPDWDPVLNWASSYVWHLCAFDRLAALELGVFSDAGSEFCQDWDTVVRFANAGHKPHHVPEVLYHWRQHDASSSNRAAAVDADTRSVSSTRHLLESRIADLPEAQRYEVQEFPIFRGATEFHVARRRIEPATMDLIVIARAPVDGARALRAVLDQCDYPIGSVCVVNAGALEPDDIDGYEAAAGARAARLERVQGESTAAVLNAARRTAGDYLLVCSDAIGAVRPDACWESLKLFELCRDTALVCGRTVDRHGVVVQGAAVLGADGLPMFLDTGEPASDAGPYALLLKAHTVGMVHCDFFFAAGPFLRQAALPHAASLAALGLWLGASAARARQRVAYSPLTAAEVHSTVLGLTNGRQLDREEREAFLLACRTALPTSSLSAQRYVERYTLFS